MPGYFAHIACASVALRSSRLALKGLIAPDAWKLAAPTEEAYLAFFRDCPEGNESFKVPAYEDILLLCSERHSGTHFGEKVGATNHTNLALFEELFTSGRLDASNPFYIGYLHHLRTDIDFYADSTACDHEAFNRDKAQNEKWAMEILHADWDKTNQFICDWYPEVPGMVSLLPPSEREKIGFVNGVPHYIKPAGMHVFIERMRRFDTFEELLRGTADGFSE